MTPAAERREVILDVLKKKGTCLCDYLYEAVRSITKQDIVIQQIHQDVRTLMKEGKVTTQIATGAAKRTVGFSGGLRRGQKLLVVELASKR